MFCFVFLWKREQKRFPSLNCVEYFCLFYLKKLAWSVCKVVLIQCGNGVTYVFVPATLPQLMSQVGGIRRPVSPDYSLKFAEVCFLEFKWKQSLSLVEIKRNEDYFLFSFGESCFNRWTSRQRKASGFFRRLVIYYELLRKILLS